MASVIVIPLRADTVTGPYLHVVRQGDNVIISWPATNNAFGVQYSADLYASNWIMLPDVNIVGTNYVATNQMMDLTRYYRLISPCGEIAPPTLGPVLSQNVTSTRYITANGEAVTDLDILVPIMGDATNILDASAFIDPSSCVPGTLDYRWVVSYIRNDDGSLVTPYTDAGITGYLKPVLKISPDAMPQGLGYIDLTVSSRVHPEQWSAYRIKIEIDDATKLRISSYLQCRVTGSLCDRTQPNCLCYIAAALPTSEPH